jgi:3-phenylpropionate/trans-cinnamate dioxygenase ferredoxin subunit
MSATHVVCRFDDLDDGEIRRVDIGSSAVALVRIDDRVYAIGDTCSHQNVSLSEGEVDLETMSLECPKHGSAFSLLTGDALSLPAVKGVPTYDVVVDDGDVKVVIA